MYFRTAAFTLAFAAIATAATASSLSSASECLTQFKFDSVDDTKALTFESFASTLKSGAECGASEVKQAVAALESFGSSTKNQTEAEVKNKKVQASLEEQANDAGDKVKASYTYLSDLSKNATAAFKDAEENWAKSDVAASAAEFESFYKDITEAVEKFHPFAAYFASVKKAAQQLYSAENDFTSSLEHYSKDLYTQIHASAETTEDVLKQGVAALTQTSHAVSDLVQELM